MTYPELVAELSKLKARSDSAFTGKNKDAAIDPMYADKVVTKVKQGEYVKYNPYGASPTWEDDAVLGRLVKMLQSLRRVGVKPWWPSQSRAHQSRRSSALLLFGIKGCGTIFHVDNTEALNAAIAMVR